MHAALRISRGVHYILLRGVDVCPVCAYVKGGDD